MNTNFQQTSKHVPRNVLISCEESKVEINSQGKSLSFANYAENQNSFLHLKTENFVQMLVHINSICEKIIIFGKEESLQNEQFSIHQKNGKVFVTLFGREMMQLAKDVKNDSTILSRHLKYITSSPLNSKSIDSELIISFFYVVSAIYGYIQKETELQSSLNLDLYSSFGWTKYGKMDGKIFEISDSQRYKMLGNAVTVNVIEAIARKLEDSTGWGNECRDNRDTDEGFGRGLPHGRKDVP